MTDKDAQMPDEIYAMKALDSGQQFWVSARDKLTAITHDLFKPVKYTRADKAIPPEGFTLVENGKLKHMERLAEKWLAHAEAEVVPPEVIAQMPDEIWLKQDEMGFISEDTRIARADKYIRADIAEKITDPDLTIAYMVGHSHGKDKAIPPEVIAQVAAALDAYGQLYDTDGDHTESTGDAIRRRGRKALALLQPYVREGI